MHSNSSYKYIFILTFTGAILALQLWVNISCVTGNWVGIRYWPIVNYPMYAYSKHEGDHVQVQRFIEIVHGNDQRTEITIKDYGQGFWRFNGTTLSLMRGDESTQKAVDSVLRVASAKNITDIEAIEVLSYPVIVTRHGAQEASKDLLTRVSVR